MIVVQNKNATNIVVQKPYDIDVGYYTIILQNTITKEITHFTVEDNYSNKMYIHLTLDFSNLVDGEYYMLLVSNPNRLTINITNNYINDIKTMQMYVTLTNDGIILKNGEDILATTMEMGIDIITQELIKLGSYTPNNQQYKSTENKYITYNG